MKKKFESIISGSDFVGDNVKNKEWWNNNLMNYDWDNELGNIEYTKDYFSKIDNIFGYGHSLINNPKWPNSKILENFIPYELFKEKKVLEIGCGAGLVASHISDSGAILSAIDITDEAIKTTKERFKLFNLKGDILRMDAESLDFQDNCFDFVVSWGVIHHSGNMRNILQEIRRVLKPNGKAFIMIYNKNSIRYHIYCKFWLGIMKMKFLKYSLNEIVGSVTDGYIARHSTNNDFKKLVTQFTSVKFSYSDEKLTILKYLFGIALPFKYLSTLTKPLEKFLATRWGWYLQITLIK